MNQDTAGVYTSFVQEAIASERPDRLERYTLLRRIAVGGMAEVFEAADEATGARVVVKLLLPQLCHDAEVLQMFADEARLTTRLEHPNLVRALDAGLLRDRPYLVMELVDGCTLEALLQRSGPLAPPVAARVAGAMLLGLEYLHGYCDERGQCLKIVHRDVNPRNVLLSRAGEVKLADFGIARSRVRAARTRSGVIKGTVQYMSPEQITGSDPDQRADLYGVGLVLFEMLTGQSYIEGSKEIDLLREAESPRWRAPSSISRALHPQFDALIEPALRRFPEQRYRDAKAFEFALQQTLEHCGIREADAAQLGALVSALPPRSATVPPLATDGFRQLAASSAGTTSAEGPRVSKAPIVPRSSAESPARRRIWRSSARVSIAVIFALVATGAVWSLWRARSPTAPQEQATRHPAPRASGAGFASTRAPTRAPEVGNVPPLGEAPAAATQEATDAGAEDTRITPGLRRRVEPRRRTRSPALRAGLGTPPSGNVRAERPDAGPERAEPVEPTEPDLHGEVAARLAALRRGLAARGILPLDLLPGDRQDLARARKAIEARETASASAIVTALEARLDALLIDQVFVQRKLARIDRALRDLPARRRQDLPRLRERSTEALQAFMDGDYARANQQLNEIVRIIDG